MAEENTAIFSEEQEFIKSLHHHLFSSPREVNALKRAFGRPITDDISTYMSFLKVSGGHIYRPKEKIYFLIACMYYLYEKPDSEGNYIPFETLLGRLYGQTGSTDSDIAFLVNCDDLDNGMFLKKFVSYANRCKALLKGNERVDFCKLLKDLKSWNREDKTTRLKWAREITKKG